MLVRVGDRIPLDGKVVEGTSYLDTSAITGESVPIRCDIGDSVISGSVNTSGMLKIRVEKILAESMVSKILAAVEDAAAKKPKVERLITRFAKIYTPIVVIMAVLLATIPSFITGDWQRWIYTALTFLVISCPCALVLSVPLSYFAGIGVASKQGILFKSGNLMETLKDIKMVEIGRAHV